MDETKLLAEIDRLYDKFGTHNDDEYAEFNDYGRGAEDVLNELMKFIFAETP